jgi:hypothetical protein
VSRNYEHGGNLLRKKEAYSWNIVANFHKLHIVYYLSRRRKFIWHLEQAQELEVVELDLVLALELVLL